MSLGTTKAETPFAPGVLGSVRLLGQCGSEGLYLQVSVRENRLRV